MRLSNPFYTRTPGGGGSPQSGGAISVGSPVDPLGGGVGDGLAKMFSTIVGAATYDEDRDPRAQAAKKYSAEAAALADEAYGRQTLGGLFSTFNPTGDPEATRTLVQRAAGAAAAAGIKPQQIADLFRFMIPNTPGTTEDQIRRASVGAGGAALGKDQSFTVAGQNEIRRDNERVADEDRVTQEGGLNGRNAATIAGAMEREKLVEAGRDKRRYDTPVNAAPGTTTYFGPGDPRNSTGSPAPTTPGRPLSLPQLVAELVEKGDIAGAERAASLGKRTGAPNDVSPKDVEGIDGLIGAQYKALGVDPETVDPALDASIRARASELYQQTRNAQGAVNQAIQELTEAGTDDRFDFGTGVRDRPTLKPKAGAAPTSAPAGGVAVGTTATHPATGEKVRWNGSAWEPVK